MKIAQNYGHVSLPLSHTSPKCNFFAGRHFFIRKMKIKMANRLEHHVLSKVVKNAVLHHKTF